MRGMKEDLAGAEGFEPPKAVLETAGLPLAYAPISGSHSSIKQLGTATQYEFSPQTKASKKTELLDDF